MNPRVLVLFFTRGVSLMEWVERGMFDREKRTYEELLRRGHVDEVLWLTYGEHDQKFAEQLSREGVLHPGIRVLPMPHCFASRWGRMFYSLVAPWLHRRALASAFVFKTNQMDGAWTAWVAKLLLNKTFYLRTGFTLSLFEAQGAPGKTLRIKLFAAIEKLLYRRADVASVSSLRDLAYVTGVCGAKNVRVVRNYVDVSRFNTENRNPESGRMVFVGRLHAQKNLDVFLRSLAGTAWILNLYGDGPERDRLERIAADCGVAAVFHGSVPNSELPGILSRAAVFALPSLYEGMPKALLEAMACGCLCLGADVPGVNEVIEDGVNGFLAAAPTEAGFKALFGRMADYDEDALRLVALSGAAHIRDRYSLDAIVEQEAEIMRSFS